MSQVTHGSIRRPRIPRGLFRREEFKQAVIAACCEQGASVAGIAMANGVNANQVRRRMRERGISAPTQRLPVGTSTQTAETPLTLIPLPLTPSAPELPAIRIEIRRGNAAIKINWRVQVSGECVQTIINPWSHHDREVILPDNVLLITYGLTPRYLNDGTVCWDDPRGLV